MGELGISRFPNEVSAYVHGVSDRAGLWYTSRYRCTRWGLPHLLTASASRSEFLTRLNTRPARAPVNASTLPSRAAPHDSGPMWVANPPLLSCDFFIHNTSPVLTGAQGEWDVKLITIRTGLLAVFSLLFLLNTARADVGGKITGVVKDPTGSGIPGATVVAVNTLT